MGHRALVAYERADQTYNLHYSPNGAVNLRLHERITEETPFGGIEYRPCVEAVFKQLTKTSDREVSDIEQSNLTDTAVDLEPMVTGVSLYEGINEHLDFRSHEAFYVVSSSSSSFEVFAYRPFWLGFSSESNEVTRSPAVGHGVLIRVHWSEGRPVRDGYLRGWFDGGKSIVAEFIDRKLMTESQAAHHILEAFLAELPAYSEYSIWGLDD